MIIVAGWIDVGAGDRDAFLALRNDAVLRTHGEPGCLEYVFSPDPLDPQRVRLFEMWATRPDLDLHLAEMRSRPGPTQSVAVVARSVAVYEATETEPLG